MTDKKRKQEVLTLLRCVSVYADSIVERIDNANPITDDTLETVRLIKDKTFKVFVELFKVGK